jgi:hypothetical protein
MISGEAARDAYPAQVEAALAYAAENKYAYGPAMARKNLAHTVVGAQEMPGGIVRVHIDFAPADKFRGAAGREYLDVDANGGILARRQVRVPKENLPWVLMGVAAFSVLLAAVVVPLIFFYDSSNPLYRGGRTLWIQSERPKTTSELFYTGPDVDGNMQEWIIQPEGAGTVLAYIDVTVINQTSGAVNLIVDRNSAELTTEGGIIHRPIDVIARTLHPEEYNTRLEVPGFLPMWGSVVLESGRQLKGYLVFEVPQGSQFDNLRWTASDTVILRY